VFIVYFYCILVVFNGFVKFFLLSVGKSSIVVEISFSWFDLDCLSETSDCLIVVSFAVKGYSFIIVCISIVWVNLDGL
jgi:hypothetical protein